MDVGSIDGPTFSSLRKWSFVRHWPVSRRRRATFFISGIAGHSTARLPFHILQAETDGMVFYSENRSGRTDDHGVTVVRIVNASVLTDHIRHLEFRLCRDRNR